MLLPAFFSSFSVGPAEFFSSRHLISSRPMNLLEEALNSYTPHRDYLSPLLLLPSHADSLSLFSLMALPEFFSSFKKRMGSIFFGDLPKPKKFDRDELQKLDVLEQAMDAGIEVEAAQQHFSALKDAIERGEDLLGALQESMENGQLPEPGAVADRLLTKGQIEKRLKQRDEWVTGERKLLDDGRKAFAVFNLTIFGLAASSVGSKMLTKVECALWFWRLNEALLVAAPLCVCLVNLVMVGRKPLIALFLIMLGALLVYVVLMAELFFRGYIGK